MSYLIPGRAHTPEQKRAIVDRILRAWIAAPDLRLGQLLANACEPSPTPLFYVEDASLATLAERQAGEVEPHNLTSSEIALAKVLAAWDEWDPSLTDPNFTARKVMSGMTMPLCEEGFATTHALTNAGRDLVARARKAGVL